MIFVVFAGLTIIPSMILWRTGNRYLRGTAVGLAGAFLSVLVLLAWRPWATMSDEEVDRAKAEVLASGHADVYLGDAVARYPLNAYYLDGGEANSHYGTCHPSADYAEGGCTAWDMSIHNTWRDVTIGGDAIAGCIRQKVPESTRGSTGGRAGSRDLPAGSHNHASTLTSSNTVFRLDSHRHTPWHDR